MIFLLKMGFSGTKLAVVIVFLTIHLNTVLSASTQSANSSTQDSTPSSGSTQNNQPGVPTIPGQAGSTSANTGSSKSFQEKEIMVAVFTLVLLVFSGLLVIAVVCIGEFENKRTGLWRSRRLSVAVDHDHQDLEKEISKYNKF